MGVRVLEIPLPIWLVREFGLGRLRFAKVVIIDALPVGLPRGGHERLPRRDGRLGVLQEGRDGSLNAVVREAVATDFEVGLFIEHHVTRLREPRDVRELVGRVDDVHGRTAILRPRDTLPLPDRRTGVVTTRAGEFDSLIVVFGEIGVCCREWDAFAVTYFVEPVGGRRSLHRY